MIDSVKVIIEVNDKDNSKCSLDCPELDKDPGRNTRHRCKLFNANIFDLDRCERCLEPQIFQGQVDAWGAEMEADEKTRNGASKICEALRQQKIKNAIIQPDCNTITLRMVDGNTSVSISDTRIIVHEGRKDKAVYLWRPWV